MGSDLSPQELPGRREAWSLFSGHPSSARERTENDVKMHKKSSNRRVILFPGSSRMSRRPADTELGAQGEGQGGGTGAKAEMCR